MMTASSWLRSAGLVVVGVMVVVATAAPPAFSKPKKKKAEATPTATATATPAPTPEAKVWNFDSDQAGKLPDAWQDVDGAGWEVFSDPSAPSQPNDFGLPAGRAVSSLMHGLEYHPKIVMKDPTEYSDFTLEADFKPIKGYFDCSGGLIFRYGDASNYYVLAMGCPSDYFQLLRMYQGKLDQVQQKVLAIDAGNWYKIKLDVEGDHFVAYEEGKMIFDGQDNKIAKGRIGFWSSNDSQARFDNLKLTLPLSASTGADSTGVPTGAPAAAAPPPPPPPPPPP
ncbi:MAG TPA: family 16 glycoside hydrolase [Candidatus Binataceae bacterium]|nr:family 16 glycoside hydrolase [Candidatus Binataceae bacterium]